MPAAALDMYLRTGTKGDAVALARLINYAGEGLPLYLWERMAEPGETAWDVGLRRARREEGSFSYRNAILAEVDGMVAACLIGYAVPDVPEPVGSGMPALFVPLQELENLATSSWYINVLATEPLFRGQGIGSRLIARAEEEAYKAGCKGLSIIVSDANHDARRLYERCGCVETATRPMVKDGWENDGVNWVLLTKDLA